MRLCIEDEDEEFKEEFHQVINSKYLKYIDAPKRKVNRTHATADMNKTGNVDLYLGMNLGLNKGDEEGLNSARVK